VLAASGVALAVGIGFETYLAVLPGLLLYGVGLSLVLTTNDPVSLDSLSDADSGQASGVSATAEQGGGAIGIAVLYSLFHGAYVNRLYENVDASPLADLTTAQYGSLKASLLAAEQTGLKPSAFDPSLVDYLRLTRDAARFGYVVAFLAMAAIALVGLACTAWLVRRPDEAQAADLDGLAPDPL
jgi:hypothetical protein